MSAEPSRGGTVKRKKTVVNDAVAAKIEKAQQNEGKPQTDMTIHVTDTGATVSTIQRFCQGIAFNSRSDCSCLQNPY